MTAELVELHPSSNQPAPIDTDSWTHVVADVGRLAAMIADTDFVPAAFRGNAPAVCAAILYGREVGLPPMTSLTQVYVERGRPAMYAEAMRALVLAAGHDFVRESTGAVCTVAGRRRGSNRWTPITWNLDMARAANLIRDKSAWVTFPRAMLVARATAELCRVVFPDVIHGFRAFEELDSVPLDETAPEQAEPSQSVRRQSPRKAPRTPAPPPGLPAPPDPRPGQTVPPPLAQDGPPLPGEPGYDTDDPSAPPPADSGDAEAPTPSDAADPHHTASEGTDTPDVEVVNDPTPRLPRNYRSKILIEFGRLGITNRDHRLGYYTVLTGRDGITTTNDLTREEAHKILDTLSMCGDRDALDTVAAATEQHDDAEQQQLPDVDN